MGLISRILFPVDFSRSAVGMAPYVRRAAQLFNAHVSLIHVFDPASYNGFELVASSPYETAERHQQAGRDRLEAFLRDEFPPAESERILEAGDAATVIARTARKGFDLIMMPSHAGTFRRMLLGSTTAKVLNDADCPVATSNHAEQIAPRPLDHRMWLCTIGLGEDSERLLRFAHQAATEARVDLCILHAIYGRDLATPLRLDLEERIECEERRRARERIAELQQRVGSNARVRIVAGPIKEALIEGARGIDADALIIARSPLPGVHGRLRDLTYAIVRDSPFPVISV